MVNSVANTSDNAVIGTHLVTSYWLGKVGIAVIVRRTKVSLKLQEVGDDVTLKVF